MRKQLWYGLWVLSMMGCAEMEEGKGYLLRHVSVAMPQAVQAAERNGHGRAVRAELGHSGSQVYYDVDVVDTINKLRRIRVDAETGAVIRGS